ncbi:roadblock/LC7 domain-containing protein [Streptomyces sp. NPDC059604]|uniref:roadblock/LC7 domain-containing protein n=1 Tax=Streptomyces sp. NPDC059604 TaxID=3346881 RepID=UPI0036CDDD8B
MTGSTANMPTSSAEDLNWLLGELPELPGVRHTLLVTSDGLAQKYCKSTTEDLADRTAAAISGMQALSGVFAHEYAPKGTDPMAVRGGPQVITIPGGHVFLRPTANGAAVLAVITGPGADPGMIAQYMQERVQKLGEQLEAPARTPVPEHG